MKVLLIKNITREGPGLLSEILRDNRINYDIVDLGKNEEFPNVKDYSAVAVFGGPDSANDDNFKMKSELEKIKKAIDSKIPYLGICLGMQALVKACGGEVVKNEIKEIGFRDAAGNFFEVNINPEGATDPLFTNLSANFKMFHLHGETVRLKSGMKLLAAGKFCKNQIVKIGENAYGIQGHLELTEEMFDLWANEDPDLLRLNKENLKNDFKLIKEEYQNNGKQIFRNFLKISKLL